MPGFGLQPAGLTAFGVGSPVGLPLPGHGYESTADLVAARALDLPNKDYAVDDDTTAVPHDEWDGLAQNVVLRLTTRRGALPFDRTLGNAFLSLDRLPLDLIGFARRCAAEALSDLIASDQVALVDVAAERGGAGLATMAVTWVDLRTRQQRTTPATATGTR